MHPEDNKTGFTKPDQFQHTIRKQDSFINKMSIFGNNVFERLPSQSRDIPIIPEQSSYFPRQQSHGNVFKGFRRQEPQRVLETKQNTVHTYQRQCLEYEKYLFDTRIKMIIKRMAIKAYSLFKNQKEGQFFVFPIQKLLVTIAKKLLLNRFQLLFLQYALEQTRWRYDTDCIRKHSNNFKSYMMVSDSEGQGAAQIKLMQIYILYCAYFSKKSLNELPSDNMFISFCQQICPRFKDFFPEWTQNYNMGARINPKLLNNIFKRLTFGLERDHEQFQNYCLVVQQIIDISPAYNADKSGKPKKAKKPKKQVKNKEEESISQIAGNSNRLPQQLIQQDESIDMQPPPLFKQKKSSVLSVDLLEANHYLTRSTSQHERR